MKLILFTVLLTCVVVHPMTAQILKINKNLLSVDSANHFIGAVDATFAFNNSTSTAEEQNTYIGINSNLDLVYLAKKSATLLIGGINYFQIGESTAIYNGSVHLRYILSRRSKLTPEFYTQLQFDQSRNMEFRRLLGAGYRWAILQKKNSLYAGLGIFQENERWNGEIDLIEKNLWKINSYVSADVKITSTTNINAIGYFQTGYDSAIESFRNRFSGNFEIKNAITDHLKIKLSAQFLLDDKPIIPLNKFTYEMYLGVEYHFK